jgi:hypothetical protein
MIPRRRRHFPEFPPKDRIPNHRFLTVPWIGVFTGFFFLLTFYSIFRSSDDLFKFSYAWQTSNFVILPLSCVRSYFVFILFLIFARFSMSPFTSREIYWVWNLWITSNAVPDFGSTLQFPVLEIGVLQILCVYFRARLHTFQRLLHRPTPSNRCSLFLGQFALFAGLFWILQSVPIFKWKKADFHALLDLETSLIWLTGDICGNIADWFGYRSSVKSILIISCVLPFIFPLVGASLLLWNGEFLRGICSLSKLQLINRLFRFEFRFWQWRELRDESVERVVMATKEDIERESICLVCRGEMTVLDARKMDCGYCLHRDCLRSWMKRRPVCPACGRQVRFSK